MAEYLLYKYFIYYVIRNGFSCKQMGTILLKAIALIFETKKRKKNNKLCTLVKVSLLNIILRKNVDIILCF